MAEMHTNAEILAYLIAQGAQNPVVHDEHPTVFICVDTTAELTHEQKEYIRNNTPYYVHCDFNCEV